MDETWLYQYDQETKKQSMEWCIPARPAPKISDCKNPLENFSPRFFLDQEGIPFIDYLVKSQTIKAK
jgi:hypothetical protein